MILSFEPIDMKALADAISVLVEVGEIRSSSDLSPFDEESSRAILTEAEEIFRQYIEDNAERENAVRRALAWALNLEDEELLALTLRIRMPFPNTAISDRRRFLESLWQATFDNWQIRGFKPHDYNVEGMPPIEPWMAIVFERAGLKPPSG